MKQLTFIWIFLYLFASHQTESRSIFRTPNNTIPSIEVTSSNPEYTHEFCPKAAQDSTSTLQSKYLRLKTFKRTFNKSQFKKQMIPNGTIKCRRSDQTVESALLQSQAETIVEEIKQGKKEFTHFKVLKDRDFNYHEKSGLLVVKYKDYPFVLKLFIEHPHTFVRPLNRSFEASCIFVLSGTLRHLSGFTRITNLNNAKKALLKDAQYKYYLDFPQKWFWTPQANTMLKIKWNDEYNQHYETIEVPSIYGLIADFVHADTKIQKEESHTLRQIAIDVANYLHYIIDPHVDNFMPEYQSNKIVLIDTEHFPTIAGFDQTMNANGYIQWYFELTGRYLKRQFARTKQERIADQCYL